MLLFTFGITYRCTHALKICRAAEYSLNLSELQRSYRTKAGIESDGDAIVNHAMHVPVQKRKPALTLKTPHLLPIVSLRLNKTARLKTAWLSCLQMPTSSAHGTSHHKEKKKRAESDILRGHQDLQACHKRK
ncbi:hypothetical protein BDY21DRAFT_191538 [Lineolata rhizophorae]|uniref:Uncharacterized protein n=1 Tax=Lineolata rhizophorae TaxID=578093 RepID=A0A6A6P7T6_9PEZI|nr:hypothetical protein BDY21DRAFT_191538 [Lineolata rhizophorae]